MDIIITGQTSYEIRFSPSDEVLGEFGGVYLFDENSLVKKWTIAPDHGPTHLKII